MKNLIERIEELLKTARNYYRNYSDRDILSETRGQIEAYQDCLDVLNQYNLITAPKSIKLSEILNKLNTSEQNYFEIIINASSIVIENSNCNREYFYISDNKIFDLSEYMVKEEFKWLYTLWIAGTEIVDDFECDE